MMAGTLLRPGELRLVGTFRLLLRPRSHHLGSTPLGLHCVLIYFAQTTFGFYNRASFGFAFNAVTGLLHEPFRVRRSPFFVGRHSEINRLLGHRGSYKEGEGLCLHPFVGILASRHPPDKRVLFLSCDSISLVE